MGASKVAQWKIDKIANTLANKGYNERIKAVVECGKKIVEDFYRKQIPEEILVLWEKYKDKGVFHERSGWYLYYHNNKGGYKLQLAIQFIPPRISFYQPQGR